MSAIFATEKHKIKQAFTVATASYDKYATLQRQVAQDLTRLFAVDIANECVVDLGCGTGFLIQQLLTDATTDTPAQQMIAVDISQSMLKTLYTKLHTSNIIQCVCADIEALPLRTHSADKLVSNLAFQWCQNLATAFTHYKQILKPNSQLIFSTFGTQTLQELKQSWAQVDGNDHVNTFCTATMLDRFLQRAEFKNIQIEQRCYTLNYSSVLALMKTLKGIGANHVMFRRNQKTTTKTQAQAMIDAYECYRINGAIPATYDVIFVCATT